MNKAPYNKDRKYDEYLSKIIEIIKEKLVVKEDDFLLLIVGSTGAGKSHLALHILSKYMGDAASTKFIGLDKEGFSQALRLAKDSPLPRCLLYDEANISKRGAMERWNKRLIDLYLAIRGLRILHIWANPSLEMLDKFFVKERIKGVVFITDKAYDRPRIYYYFRKKDLLRFWNKYGSFDLNLLRRVRGEYAYYRGWFKPYEGKLIEPYMELKENRMQEKVDTFFEDYGQPKGNGKLSARQVADKLGVHINTLGRYEKQLDEGLVTRSPTGFRYFDEKALPLIAELMNKRYKNKRRGLKNVKG